jgi:hypothetical protein
MGIERRLRAVEIATARTPGLAAPQRPTLERPAPPGRGVPADS